MDNKKNIFVLKKFSSGSGITEYLLYPQIESNQLISITSSFIVLYQNTDIQSNKILFYTFNDDKITIAETSDSVIFIFPSFFFENRNVSSYLSIDGFSLCCNFS